MNQNPQISIYLIVVGLLLSGISKNVSGMPAPEYFYEMQYKEQLRAAKDQAQAEKRTKIISEFIAVANDDTQEWRFRRFAASKLGELKALEAKENLKELADKLEWDDTSRYLKGSVINAYWQIRVAEEPNELAQEVLLVKLISDNPPPPYGGGMPFWPVEELANRGVKRALPEIIKAIKFSSSGKREEQLIRLCTTKIKLLTESESRFDALFEALYMKPLTPEYALKHWAIAELGKLADPRGIETLLDYALGLQKTYYDDSGKQIIDKNDRLSTYAGEFYRTILVAVHGF